MHFHIFYVFKSTGEIFSFCKIKRDFSIDFRNGRKIAHYHIGLIWVIVARIISTTHRAFRNLIVEIFQPFF
jgi:hypothetical protein